jgi:NAD(P)-dependent dehydrogenase (short-subunit alcohol dehydrogenase family)
MTSTTIDWTLADLPDLSGATAVVTGASRGLGRAVADLLTRAGATVLTGARTGGTPLDLADPASVRDFAAGVASRTDRLDLLVNNAGISNQPFGLAPTGVERQLAVNHLGHFALTDALLPLLTRASGRVVTVSSAMYPMGSLDLALLADEASYTPGGGYVRSKLANVLFATELDARLRAAGSPVRSLLAHPGLADTAMHDTYPDAATTQMVRAALAEQGRAPEPASVGILYAATAPTVDAALLYGPDGDREKPHVLADPVTGPALDRALAAELWDVSARLVTRA